MLFHPQDVEQSKNSESHDPEAGCFRKLRELDFLPIKKVKPLDARYRIMGELFKKRAGVMLGGTLAQVAGVDWDIAMPGSIFLLAGTGLLTGFFITRKMERED